MALHAGTLGEGIIEKVPTDWMEWRERRRKETPGFERKKQTKKKLFGQRDDLTIFLIVLY